MSLQERSPVTVQPVGPEVAAAGQVAGHLAAGAEAAVTSTSDQHQPRHFEGRDHTNPVTMKLPDSWFPRRVVEAGRRLRPVAPNTAFN